MTSGADFWQKISLATQASLRRVARRVLFAGLLVAVLVPRGSAQSNPEKPKLEDVFLSLEGTPALGDENARVVIVEYGDYECPSCGQHAAQVLPQIVNDYVSAGKIRYFFKDAPIEAIHPHAFKAAEAAHCAGEQGKYWEMHDRLFKNQQALDVKQMPAHALALGLDVPKFQQCLDSGTYAAQIRKDLRDAIQYGARGTPTFFVGMLDSQEPGKKAVSVLSGVQSFIAFQQVLGPMLSSPKEQKGQAR
jgi:protein-disulfide isomerase